MSMSQKQLGVRIYLERVSLTMSFCLKLSDEMGSIWGTGLMTKDDYLGAVLYIFTPYLRRKNFGEKTNITKVYFAITYRMKSFNFNF